MKSTSPMSEQYTKKAKTGDPGAILLICYLLAVVILLLVGTFSQASATALVKDTDTVTLEDVHDGELLIVSDESGRYTKATRLSQKVDIRINGMIADVTLVQDFSNDSDRWIEAVYAFPLPDESAVQKMKMKVGDREIIGEIKEKEKARAIYEKAKSEGKKTSLLAQKRPNIFTMAVANIPPMSTIRVEIDYVEVVRFTDQKFSLRFPMVIGPRYIPGQPVTVKQHIEFDEGGWATDTDQVPDASQITPPVAAPGQPVLNPVELTLSLAPGFPVQGLTSLYHGIDIQEKEANRYEVKFSGQVYADRDFVLEYRAANEKNVSASLFSEKRNSMYYYMLMIMPPVQKPSFTVAREVIFILDISGSMAGESIRQAKEALQLAVTRLNDKDRFNIIVFNNTAKKIYPAALPASEANKNKAVSMISSITANGGTEMAQALHLALDGRKEHELLRQVIFLTDGAVGNERALFSLIQERLGDSRLFTVGIGSAPNSYFMSRAAAVGRGSYSYIGKIDEVTTTMEALFEKLEHPVVSHIQLHDAAQGKYELYPSPMPDLYSGEPMMAFIRSSSEIQQLKMNGMFLGSGWETEIEIGGREDSRGISAVWARKKIRSLMESLTLGAAEAEVRRQVVETALNHHLVSKYTSLVAVEQELSRPAAEKLENQQVKSNLPHGWQHQKVFGSRAKTGTSAQLNICIGLILLVLSMILFKRRRGIQ